MSPPNRDTTDLARAPARDRYDLKMEIDSAQQDLEHSLHELKDALVHKVDLRAKVEERLEASKASALDYVVRGRELGLELAARARAAFQDRPVVVIGVIGGVVLVTGLALTIRAELRATS